MIKTVEAIFENGVFKPLTPPEIPIHQVKPTATQFPPQSHKGHKE